MFLLIKRLNILTSFFKRSYNVGQINVRLRLSNKFWFKKKFSFSLSNQFGGDNVIFILKKNSSEWILNFTMKAPKLVEFSEYIGRIDHSLVKQNLKKINCAKVTSTFTENLRALYITFWRTPNIFNCLFAKKNFSTMTF